jgi:hypothetical protein
MRSKENHLFNHIQNPTFRDEPCRLHFPADNVDRLHPTYAMDPGDWRNVAQIISGSTKFGTGWFPDANVAILDEAAPAWDALRIAALGSRHGSTFFTAAVRGELKEWLEEPRHHINRANATKDAIANRTWARKFGLRDSSPILPAILGYARLLGLRRYLAVPTSNGQTMIGTNSEKKCETMNAIAMQIGRRAQGLAKKGRIDWEENGNVNINDELHCLMAICYSLLTGRESVVLTGDEDFKEIFWKAHWFFDTHYRAHLAAQLIKRGKYGKPAGVLQETRGYFDGSLTLYGPYSTQLREVLPRAYKPVPVSIIYVAPNKMLHKIGFMFEREMLAMLTIRSKTGGRCTDLFGEENIHVDLGPLKAGLEGPYFGIGRDTGHWTETNNLRCFLSRLDRGHALACQERFCLIT